ncbi:hypothetical protein [Mesorhizobium sp. IMUNJ 23232]|uniref:hypothetical protein n=1 Tax=Mesorhizobium sp. IMUNJ 23232 TaxID=3376064 RepID=UPI0037895BA8
MPLVLLPVVAGGATLMANSAMPRLPCNEVSVNQTGNSLLIVQHAVLASVNDDSNQLGIVQTGATNMSLLAQAGSGNSLFVRQF